MHISRPVIPMRFTRFCLAVGTLSGIAALSLGSQAAWADSTCTSPTNGPTGPDAVSFTYQCDGTYAGDWTNSYYVYDPTTSAQTALYSPDYSYDCTTGTWTKVEWDYGTSTGGYVENRVATTAPPDQPTNCSTVAGTNSTNATAGSGSAITTPATSPNNPSPASYNTDRNTTVATAPPDPSVSCVAPTAAHDTSAPAPASESTNNSVSMNNGICSTAQSGDASVTDNRSAGDASSGNATTEITAASLVDSTSNTSSNGTVAFTKDINGDVKGDFVFDPSAIGANNASSNSGSSAGIVNTDASIDNAITATAVSGDATVSGNGEGGNANSGNAEAIVNLINMINSAIEAGQSFVGTINIYGNLNGNILIPQSVIDQLLASNAVSDSSNSSSNFNNNESITNNVNASANSGAATVSGNNYGGNATSGNAKTNVTIMNLTGSSIVGKNVLLVFVNVLGQWVGMLLNAPAGATSAEFGGGITSSTAGIGSNVVRADANLSITNDVSASATSGDATVANNWVGENATSGNAGTVVNILNVEDSTLSLANWFGVLFINVFGTWNGNFGIQPTTAPSTPSGNANGGSTTATGSHGYRQTPHHFATFVASTATAVTTTGSGDTTGVLGDTASAPIAHQVSDSTLPASNNDEHANYALPAVGLFLALLLLVGAERERLFKRKG